MRVSSLVEVWRAEGTTAVRDRLWDRAIEIRRRRSAEDLEAQTSPSSTPAPLLNVIGVPMSSIYGGVPLQLRARLRREATHRPIALLSREADGRLRIEHWTHGGGRVRAATIDGGGWNGDPLIEDAALLNAIVRCCDQVGAGGVHVENAAGLSLASLTRLAEVLAPRPLILSVHDFSLFNRNPHDHTIDRAPHAEFGARLLSMASHAIYPSCFLRDRVEAVLHQQGGIMRGVSHVIAPGIEWDHAPASAAPRSPRRQIALVGGGQDHKGGARWPSLAAALVARGAQVTVYGGYGHEHLRALRRIHGVRVRGYYRAGSLPSLLARQRTDVVVMLPRVPESFSLVLSEAWAAGVPVVAPARGAFTERLAHGGGRLVSADPDDAEVLAAIDHLLAAPREAMPAPPTTQQAAEHHLALYREAGLMTTAATG